jgi:hypothetical protein
LRLLGNECDGNALGVSLSWLMDRTLVAAFIGIGEDILL